jgi:type I restriction-modification system DNA methylase subunit
MKNSFQQQTEHLLDTILQQQYSLSEALPTIIAQHCYFQQYKTKQTDPAVLWDSYGTPAKSGIQLWSQNEFISIHFEIIQTDIGSLYQSLLQHSKTQKFLGQFYTPTSIIDSIVSNCITASDQSIVDPACGAGYFLTSAFSVIQPIHGLPKAIQMLYGVDIDKHAVAITRYSLFARVAYQKQYAQILERNIRHGNALVHAKEKDITVSDIDQPFLWRKEFHWLFSSDETENGFDAVIGNPPYLFLSGKGSPVRKLEKNGLQQQADKLKQEIETYKRMYPQTSKGCCDLYKWFIQLSLEIVKPSGKVGLLVPSSWIRLQRYKDVRILLTNNNLSEIEEYGAKAFPHLTVPNAVLFCFPNTDGVKYTDRRMSPPKTKFLERKTPFELFQDPLCQKIYQSQFSKLKEFCTIREGIHKVKKQAYSKSDALPLYIDEKMQRMKAPPTIYVCPPTTFSKERHSGPRILLRKTSDQLICAPVSSDEPILCHQNCYVIHPNKDINHIALAILINSKMLSFLYRKSPMGMEKRSLAQLRISALLELPIPKEIALPKVQTNLITSLKITNQLNQEIYSLYGLSITERRQIEQCTQDINWPL